MPRKLPSQPPGRQDLIEEQAPKVPKKYRALWRRAMEGSPSKANAIRVKCLECSNFSQPEITHCTVHQCPLWLYRPYQKR